MVVIYNILIFLYLQLIKVASFFNSKARLWLEGRKGTWKRLDELSKRREKVIWIHCSSLGEFEQGRPVIEKIKNDHPDWKLLLTFFSPSGYEVRKNYSHADYIDYMPLDTKRNAKRFLDLAKPGIALFVKYEFWYHHLVELKRRNISTFLISANFRDNQVFFKWYGTWYRKMLLTFQGIFVQNERSKTLLESIGIRNVNITGDTRFDRVKQIAMHSKDIPLAKIFRNNEFVLVAGSTWDKDEQLLISYLADAANSVKMILAPHEIDKNHVAKLSDKFNREAVLFSEANPEMVIKARVLIVDNFGMLSSLYRYGDVAYIGGGFGTGIHNILEAATFGIPVLFGPNYQKFQEAIKLVSMRGAFTVGNIEDLKSIMYRFIHDPEFLKDTGMIAGSYVQQNTGATEAVIRILDEKLAS